MLRGTLSLENCHRRSYLPGMMYASRDSFTDVMHASRHFRGTPSLENDHRRSYLPGMMYALRDSLTGESSFKHIFTSDDVCLPRLKASRSILDTTSSSILALSSCYNYFCS